MTDRIRPFDNGSQYADWEGSNCERCTKSGEIEGTVICPIREALITAYWGDGLVSPEIAHRMGHTEYEGRYVWPCSEVQWTQEWKDRFARSKGYANADAMIAARSV